MRATVDVSAHRFCKVVQQRKRLRLARMGQWSDVFVNLSSIQIKGYKSLKEGGIGEFDISKGHKVCRQITLSALSSRHQSRPRIRTCQRLLELEAVAKEVGKGMRGQSFVVSFPEGYSRSKIERRCSIRPKVESRRRCIL